MKKILLVLACVLTLSSASHAYKSRTLRLSPPGEVCCRIVISVAFFSGAGMLIASTWWEGRHTALCNTSNFYCCEASPYNRTSIVNPPMCIRPLQEEATCGSNRILSCHASVSTNQSAFAPMTYQNKVWTQPAQVIGFITVFLTGLCCLMSIS